jgi:hypothetical protein
MLLFAPRPAYAHGDVPGGLAIAAYLMLGLFAAFVAWGIYILMKEPKTDIDRSLRRTVLLLFVGLGLAFSIISVYVYMSLKVIDAPVLGPGFHPK